VIVTYKTIPNCSLNLPHGIEFIMGGAGEQSKQNPWSIPTHCVTVQSVWPTPLRNVHCLLANIMLASRLYPNYFTHSSQFPYLGALTSKPLIFYLHTLFYIREWTTIHVVRCRV